MDNEIYETEMRNKLEERVNPDAITYVKRVFGFLDEHPEVGVLAGGTLTAGGIGAMVVYGIKCVRG